MKIKTAFWLLLFTLFSMADVSANESVSTPTFPVVEQVTPTTKTETTTTTFAQWQRADKVPDRVSFPTRTGFVLLRKKELVFMTVDSKNGEVVIHYRKGGLLKKASCQVSLASVLKRVGDFPFLKVSRSTIVNMDEVEALEGTRRDAQLVLTEGSSIKVSRSIAGDLHDWMGSLSA